MNREARLCGCGANEVYHDLMAHQRLAAPIAGHVAEQAMLDLVPFARAGRKMTYLDLQPGFVAEGLQSDFPQSIAAAVAATTVGRDQQAPGCGVPATAQTLPPGPNRFHGKFGRVAAYPNAHPCLVVGQIVDSVGNRLPFSRIRKVVDSDFAWLALASPLRTRILQVSQGFLLLGVDRDCRLPLPLLRLHPAIDVAKLCVAVWMRLPFARLAVSLQTVAGSLEQVPHGCRPHRVSLSRQFLRQPPCALAGPPQGRLRIASTFGFDQTLQARPDVRVNDVDPLTSRTLPTLAIARRRRTTIEFTDAASNSTMGQACRRTQGGNTTPAQRNRFHRRPTPSRKLRELVLESSVFAFNPLNDAPIHDERHSQKPWQLMSRPHSSTYLRAVANLLWTRFRHASQLG